MVGCRNFKMASMTSFYTEKCCHLPSAYVNSWCVLCSAAGRRGSSLAAFCEINDNHGNYDDMLFR